MYAVIESGGKQYRVAEGDEIRVEKLAVEAGKNVEFDRVLMVAGEDGVKVGKPTVDGVTVSGTVTGHGRGKKIIVYKHKKNYHKKQGHRQDYTAVRIDQISA
ncbi:MAG: 50S ribosomal protein L21 [Chloroflexi bacterium]|nr:MAG: 50S ribosomal protein L21 [Chloroflexota bacterium]